ncbi:uncharacterized protein LOC134272707, partial [Saccostrea cucullata]|uniref:uncharacterized protein LOC134272707 n=1 Tax=Saccostrea cuccullata TaxID=36930 RepID=UPI002ED250F2
MAHCPTCHGGYCDFVNRDTCHMCKFDLHEGQLPHVHCLKENEHCNVNHNTLCCSDESCIARAFGSFYPSASSIRPTTSKEIHITDPSVHCPHCHGGFCDFVNRDTCHMCKFHLHTGQFPDVHCLKGNEHCHENHDTLCCKEESCIANAFGTYYPRTPSTYPTTASNKTTSTHHVMNQQRRYVSCPICSHGVCDPSRSYTFCTGCVYHEDHKTTTCIKHGHEQECKDRDKQICCLTDECITKWFGVVVNTIDQGSSSLQNFIFCPSCDHNGKCHFSLCDKCEYHTDHSPPHLRCLQQ